MKYLNGIKVYKGMFSLWKGTGIMEPVDVSYVVKKYGKKKVFSVGQNRQSVMYLNDGDCFVAPWTRELIAGLIEAKYSREFFFVPFDCGDVPMQEQNEWSILVAEAKASCRDHFVEECIRWSKSNGIVRIPRRILSKCFLIPPEGLRVRNLVYEERIVPIIDVYNPERNSVQYLGKYHFYKGLTVFVYRDGTTYVGKGYGLPKKLKHSGFEEMGMFVPFSNGSLPVDRDLRDKWLSLPVF